jgi:hypothetical protein
LIHQGAFTAIEPPGSTSSFALDINPQGDVVGAYSASGIMRGFLLRLGAFTTIEPPGSTATTATGINPEGDIVGFYVAGGVTHGFLARR